MFIILNVVIPSNMWLKWILQDGVQIEVHVIIPNSTSVNCLFYHKIKDIFELVCRYLKNVPLKKKKFDSFERFNKYSHASTTTAGTWLV